MKPPAGIRTTQHSSLIWSLFHSAPHFALLYICGCYLLPSYDFMFTYLVCTH
jgi:hypothetical protein